MSSSEFCHAYTRRIARDKSAGSTIARAALYLGINRNADQGGNRVEFYAACSVAYFGFFETS
jgi:hypothetical protein